MTWQDYQDALDRNDLPYILSPHDLDTVGTPPLGIARPDGDIDIVCCSPDPSTLAGLLRERFREANDFAIYQWSAKGRPVIKVWGIWMAGRSLPAPVLSIGSPGSGISKSNGDCRASEAQLSGRASGPAERERKTEPAFANFQA